MKYLGLFAILLTLNACQNPGRFQASQHRPEEALARNAQGAVTKKDAHSGFVDNHAPHGAQLDQSQQLNYRSGGASPPSFRERVLLQGRVRTNRPSRAVLNPAMGPGTGRSLVAR